MPKKLKVSEVFNVFTDTTYEVLRLTPKEGYKGKIQDPKILSGDKELSHNTSSGGVLSLRADGRITSTSIKDCLVSFELKQG